MIVRVGCKDTRKVCAKPLVKTMIPCSITSRERSILEYFVVVVVVAAALPQ